MSKEPAQCLEVESFGKLKSFKCRPCPNEPNTQSFATPNTGKKPPKKIDFVYLVGESEFFVYRYGDFINDPEKGYMLAVDHKAGLRELLNTPHADVLFFLLQYHKERMADLQLRAVEMTSNQRKSFGVFECTPKNWGVDKEPLIRTTETCVLVGTPYSLYAYFKQEGADESEDYRLPIEPATQTGMQTLMELLPNDLTPEQCLNDFGFCVG